MSGKAEIRKGKKKKEVDAVKCVAAATGVKWSEGRKPKADNEFRRSESIFLVVVLWNSDQLLIW